MPVKEINLNYKKKSKRRQKKKKGGTNTDWTNRNRTRWKY